MNFWIVFWKVTFIVSISLFCTMFLWVAIQGFLDIKKLTGSFDKKEKSNNN